MVQRSDARSRNEAEAHWGEAMAAAQAGDSVAYQKLLEEVLPVARSLVRARLSDHAAAEDVVQNALLSIHRARHTYRPERPFGPWMRTIVRNAVIDWHRSRQRLTSREVVFDGIDSFIDPKSAGEPEGDGLSPDLAEALAGLPEKQREAVELIHLHGLSVAEASLRAGVSASALKVRAHRGYRALRVRLRRET